MGRLRQSRCSSSFSGPAASRVKKNTETSKLRSCLKYNSSERCRARVPLLCRGRGVEGSPLPRPGQFLLPAGIINSGCTARWSHTAHTLGTETRLFLGKIGGARAGYKCTRHLQVAIPTLSISSRGISIQSWEKSPERCFELGLSSPSFLSTWGQREESFHAPKTREGEQPVLKNV